MRRDRILHRLGEDTRWDLIVIGGGASGLGVALEAVTRGYSCLLLERGDIAEATSSRSTKLIHGGVRYLEQGNLSLVREALRERSWLLEQASSLVERQRFIIPLPGLFDKTYFGIGLKLYDRLAGKSASAASGWLGRRELTAELPALNERCHRGGVHYEDARFDDARLALAVAGAIVREGGTIATACEVEGLRRDGEDWLVQAGIPETTQTLSFRAKAVVQACGPWTTKNLLNWGQEEAAEKIRVRPSRGSHLMLELPDWQSEQAMLVPRTRDGRVLFAIPWRGRLLVGTTDVATGRIERDPLADVSEVRFILETLNRYLAKPVDHRHIRARFAGLRPLVARGRGPSAKIPRNHFIEQSAPALFTLAGGKWTTFRQMGEDTLKRLENDLRWTRRPSKSRQCRLDDICGDNSSSRNRPRIPNEHLVREWTDTTFALTTEDILARRTRLLFTDAQLACEHAESVNAVLAQHLGWSEERRAADLNRFEHAAATYLPEKS